MLVLAITGSFCCTLAVVLSEYNHGCCSTPISWIAGCDTIMGVIHFCGGRPLLGVLWLLPTVTLLAAALARKVKRAK